MAKRAVTAVHLGGRRFEALEPVELPKGAHVQLVFETAEKPEQEVELLVRPGKVIDSLRREDLYADIE